MYRILEGKVVLDRNDITLLKSNFSKLSPVFKTQLEILDSQFNQSVKSQVINIYKKIAQNGPREFLKSVDQEEYYSSISDIINDLLKTTYGLSFSDLRAVSKYLKQIKYEFLSAFIRMYEFKFHIAKDPRELYFTVSNYYNDGSGYTSIERIKQYFVQGIINLLKQRGLSINWDEQAINKFEWEIFEIFKYFNEQVIFNFFKDNMVPEFSNNIYTENYIYKRVDDKYISTIIDVFKYMEYFETDLIFY